MQLTFPPPAIVAALLMVVITASVFDVRRRCIPNWVPVAGALIGIGLNAFLANSPSGAWFALKGLMLGFAVYFVLYALRAMGAGDVKLMGAVGALVGWQNWFGVFIITSILGAIMALILVVTEGRLQKTLINVGFIISEMKRGRPAYLKNEELDVRNSKALGLPHGAVIAVGCLFFLGIAAHFTR